MLLNASGCLDALTAPDVARSLDAFVTKATMRTAAAFLNALFGELETRGHWVRLESGYHRHSVDASAAGPSLHYQQARAWEPGRATIAFVSNTPIGLSLWEPIENVRVRRVGADRYVRITDLPPVRRYAPPEEDIPVPKAIEHEVSAHPSSWNLAVVR